MLLSEEETNVAEEMMIGTRDLDPLGLIWFPARTMIRTAREDRCHRLMVDAKIQRRINGRRKEKRCPQDIQIRKRMSMLVK